MGELGLSPDGGTSTSTSRAALRVEASARMQRRLEAVAAAELQAVRDLQLCTWSVDNRPAAATLTCWWEKKSGPAAALTATTSSYSGRPDQLLLFCSGKNQLQSACSPPSGSATSSPRVAKVSERRTRSRKQEEPRGTMPGAASEWLNKAPERRLAQCRRSRSTRIDEFAVSRRRDANSPTPRHTKQQNETTCRTTARSGSSATPSREKGPGSAEAQASGSRRSSATRRSSRSRRRSCRRDREDRRVAEDRRRPEKQKEEKAGRVPGTEKPRARDQLRLHSSKTGGLPVIPEAQELGPPRFIADFWGEGPTPCVPVSRIAPQWSAAETPIKVGSGDNGVCHYEFGPFGKDWDDQHFDSTFNEDESGAWNGYGVPGRLRRRQTTTLECARTKESQRLGLHDAHLTNRWVGFGYEKGEWDGGWGEYACSSGHGSHDAAGKAGSPTSFFAAMDKVAPYHESEAEGPEIEPCPNMAKFTGEANPGVRDLLEMMRRDEVQIERATLVRDVPGRRVPKAGSGSGRAERMDGPHPNFQRRERESPSHQTDLQLVPEERLSRRILLAAADDLRTDRPPPRLNSREELTAANTVRAEGRATFAGTWPTSVAVRLETENKQTVVTRGLGKLVAEKADCGLKSDASRMVPWNKLQTRSVVPRLTDGRSLARLEATHQQHRATPVAAETSRHLRPQAQLEQRPRVESVFQLTGYPPALVRQVHENPTHFAAVDDSVNPWEDIVCVVCSKGPGNYKYVPDEMHLTSKEHMRWLRYYASEADGGGESLRRFAVEDLGLLDLQGSGFCCPQVFEKRRRTDGWTDAMCANFARAGRHVHGHGQL